MKTAMKKIMTLLLVAMLLVTAIPFTAFAAEGGFPNIYFAIEGGETKTFHWQEPEGGPEHKTVKEILDKVYPGWEAKYDFVSVDGVVTDINAVINSSTTPNPTLNMRAKGVYRAKISFKQYGGNWIADKVIEKVSNGQAPTISYEEIANVMPKPQEGMESYSIAEVRTPGDKTLNPGDFYTGEYGKEEWFTVYVNVTNNGQGQTPVTKDVTLTVKNGDAILYNDSFTLNEGSNQLKKILYYKWDKAWTDKYDYVSDSKNCGLEGTIYNGDNVTVYVTSKSSKPDPEPTVKDINFVVTIGTTADNAKESFRGTFTPAQNGAAKVGDILTNKWNKNWKDSYKFENAYVKGVGNLGENDYVKAGQTVEIRVSSKSSSGGSTGDGGHNKFPYDVYLHVYLNNNLDAAHKTFDITDGIAADGVVDKNDIWNNLLKNYYSAKDSKGVTIELYKASGNWVKDFAADNQTDRIDNILDLRDDGYVHINVVLNNAKSKTSSSNNADPNNPKTGDSIGTVISVMGLSATALATMFFFNKKRIFG